jgi:hypothetical protein
LVCLCLDWQLIDCQHVIIPTDEKCVIVLIIGELPQKFVVVAFSFPMKMSGVLKCRPVFTLFLSNLPNIEIGKRF